MMREPQFLTPGLAIVLPFFLLVIAIHFRRRSREAGRSVAWRELTVPVTVMVAILGSIVVLEALFGPLWNTRLGAVVSLLGSLAFIAEGVRGLVRQRNAAGLLFQIGNPPPSRLALAPMIGFEILFVLLALPRTLDSGSAFQFSFVVLLATGTVTCVLSNPGARQLREGGVLWGSMLVPWEDIESYELDTDHDSITVSLRESGFWNPFGQLTLSVPWVDQQDVMELLSARTAEVEV